MHNQVETMDDHPKPVKGSSNKFVVTFAAMASMNWFLFGYVVGVMNGASVILRQEMHLTELKVEVLIASLNIISVVGAALAGKTSDAVGRRWALALAALLYLVGSVVMAVAPSFACLLVGRLAMGVALGYTMVIGPLYIAEISPPSIRGALVCLPEIFVAVGVISGYISNYALSHMPDQIKWRVMFAVGSIPAVFVGMGALAMPESPRWLCMRNRYDNALKVLINMSTTHEEASARLLQILNGIQYDQLRAGKGDETIDYFTSEGEGTWTEIYRPTPIVRRMLAIAIGVTFFHQASGNDSGVYYSPSIFKSAGITKDGVILGFTIGLGFSKVLFSVVATLLVDRVGRRPLLLLSACGMTFSLLTLATTIIYIHRTETLGTPKHKVSGYVAFVAAFANSGSFAVGFGPVNWVTTTEIFPARLRAKATSVSVVVNRIMSSIITLTFLSLSLKITVWAVMYVFAVMALLGGVFVYLCLPENKGKTLEQIVADFHSKQTEITPSSSHLMIWNLETKREQEKRNRPVKFEGAPFPMRVL